MFNNPKVVGNVNQNIIIVINDSYLHLSYKMLVKINLFHELFKDLLLQCTMIELFNIPITWSG